jgi:large repetitive protein
VNADIRVEFSEAINPLSVTDQTLTLVDGSGTIFASSRVFSEQNHAVTIVPHRALASGQLIQLVVAGVEDAAGNLVVPRTTSFTTQVGADVTAPQVRLTSPFAGQDDVPVNALVLVELTEPVDPTSVADSVEIRDSQTSLVVPATATLSADGRTITLQPLAPLAVNHPYSFRVLTGLRDLAGNAASFLSFSFTTALAPDTTGPVVTGTSPPDGTLDLPINAELMVQFDEPIAAHSLGQVVLRLGGQAVPATPVLSDSNRRLTIQPTAPLLALSTYTLTVAGVVDAGGNAASPLLLTFTTGAGADLRNPLAPTFTPAANATGVATNVVVTIQFNERVNPLTVTGASVRLLRNSSIPVAGTIVVAADLLSVTFTPTDPLLPLTSYTAQITSGITDLVGRTVNFTNSFFTTGTGPQ